MLHINDYTATKEICTRNILYSNHLCWSLIITYINELLEDISHGKLNVVGLEED